MTTLAIIGAGEVGSQLARADAVAFVTDLYDRIGYDTVDNSPLRESWRTTPGTPAWHDHARQDRARLEANLRAARRVARP
ncbi:hypothetical protein [Cellulomonas dongxiuzhuiae]|uniref:hypothetical protein n=1 Tax=Cellulomonas dongxiuzhuiae TaxID=2819979 RepID=UPI001AAF8407|nr:hypothetical protein [Cellulomonas dongxiuzhuiae]MBO3088250.1 hypothetical protein [Cellulomonas dongxiuzhuiae]